MDTDEVIWSILKQFFLILEFIYKAFYYTKIYILVSHKYWRQRSKFMVVEIINRFARGSHGPYNPYNILHCKHYTVLLQCI